MLSKVIARALTDYSQGASIGYRLRRRRSGPLRQMIEETFLRKGSVSVVDVGGTEQYWRILPAGYLVSRNVKITLVNVGRVPIERADIFQSLCADGCSLPFTNGSFDVAHSNSVIEHVGSWLRMKAFAQEVARIAASYFVQTPYFWFPVEPHCMTPFFHWMPPPVRVWLVMHASLGHWQRARTVEDAVLAVERINLLDMGMCQALFPDSEIITERVLMIPKSVVAVRRASPAS